MKKFRKVYKDLQKKYGLWGTTNDKIHKLIEIGCRLQSDICGKADLIKIDGFDRAKEIVGKIDKATWIEFVNIGVRKNFKTISERSQEKINSKIENHKFISGLKQAFIDSYLNTNNPQIIEDFDEVKINLEKCSNEEFASLINEHAEIRHYINDTLYKEYLKLKKAAYYITNGDISFGDFKNMVDWKYYEGWGLTGEYPDRCEKIFRKFARMLYLMTKYDMNYINTLSENYGIEIKITNIEALKNQFSEDFDEYKVKDAA